MRLIVASILVLVSLTVFLWTAGEEPSAARKVEKTDGPVRTVDRFDANGRRDGLQQIFVNGRLSHERMIEGGIPVWRKEYRPDGSLREHWAEDENYILSPVTGQTD